MLTPPSLPTITIARDLGLLPSLVFDAGCPGAEATAGDHCEREKSCGGLGMDLPTGDARNMLQIVRDVHFTPAMKQLFHPRDDTSTDFDYQPAARL